MGKNHCGNMILAKYIQALAFLHRTPSKVAPFGNTGPPANPIER